MEVRGEYQIDAPRQDVWEALNDADVLERCIPGCDSLQKVGDNEFAAIVTAAIGPVRAKFNTILSLEDLNPPESYRLVGKGKATVGFGSGSAQVQLRDNGHGTLLSYNASFKVGGKLAQIGSRLVLGATKKTADDFFGAFSKELDLGAERIEIETKLGQTTSLPGVWLAIGGAILILLTLWFLLR